MILGAGAGTRLRPLTESVPKVLVPVLGVPMLDRLRAYLARHGVEALALNTHHLPAAVQGHLAAPHAGARALLRPTLFHEPELLGTGGALVNAAAFWETAPLLVWNGDIVCGVDARTLARVHAAEGALATLVVQRRESDSSLLVDAAGWVCGIDSVRRGVRRRVRRPEGALHPVSFCGVSLLAPAVRGHLPAGGAFDLISALLDAVAAGAPVRAWDATQAVYGTTGSPAQLAALEALLDAHPAVLAAWTP